MAIKQKYRCYLCGSAQLHVVRNTVRGDVKRNQYQCDACGLVQLARAERNLDLHYKNEYRKEYSPVLGKKKSSKEVFDLYLPYQKERIELFKPYLKKKYSILDIGASSGHFLAATKPYVKKVSALELNVKDAQFMHDKLGFTVYNDPIEEDKLPKEAFDTIFILETFEHVPDPINFLKHAARALKKGGHIVIEVPNINDIEVSLFNSKDFNNFYYREPHLYNYSPKVIQKIVIKAGLSKKEIIYHQFVNVTTHFKTVFGGGLAPSVVDAWGTATLPYYPLNENQQGGEGIKKISSYEYNKKAIDVWIQKTDSKYKKLLKQLGIADTLVFVGQKK